MYKLASSFLILFFLTYSLSAQEIISSGKSKPIRLNLTPSYERGMPPNLFVNLSFVDDNTNGILEANESAKLILSISNEGKGPAQGLEIKVIDNVEDNALTIYDGKKFPYLQPGQTMEVEIPINAGFDIKTAEHKLRISVTEHFGYDMDDAYLVLNTIEFQEPELVFSGLELVDVGAGTGAIIEDGQLQAGEKVKVKIVVQNIGNNTSKGTSYKVSSGDKNIYLDDNIGKLGDIAIGEVKEFWIEVSPNKRVETTGELPLLMTLSNEHNIGTIDNFLLPIKLNQKPAKPNIVQVKGDINSLQQQVARFEFNSNKITANLSNIIEIRQVPPSKTKRNDAVAIVIGVEQYDNFVAAPYAANDAKIMEEYFKNSLGIDKVFTYTNEEVNGYFFENTFNPAYGELQRAIVEGKTDLFVFYSGHGLPSKDGSKVYLFPSDGRIEALEKQGYDLNDFYKNLAALNARSTTVFMDACFSGVSRPSETMTMQNLVAMKGVDIKPKVIHPWEHGESFTVFSSSSFNETSLGFDPSQTGLFTYYLCAGLQGKADTNGDNKISQGELKDYVIKNVTETSIKILGQQTPVFYGNEDVILIEY